MKFSSIIVGALAAVASAAPTKVENEERSIGNFQVGFDSSLFNGFQFANTDLAYIFGATGFNVDIFQTLILQQGLQAQALQGLFFQQQFDVQSLIALTELKTLLSFAELGLTNGFDLAGLPLFGAQAINLGLIFDPLAAVDLNSFIGVDLFNQIQGIAVNDFGLLSGFGGLGGGFGGIGGIFKE